MQEAGLRRVQMGKDSSTNGNLRVMRPRRHLLEITEESGKPALVPGVHPGEQAGQWGSRKTLCVVHSIVLVSTTCSRYTPTDGSDCAEDSIFQRASAARRSRAGAGKGTGGISPPAQECSIRCS